MNARLLVLALLPACAGDDGAVADAGTDAAPIADNGVATCGKPVVYLADEGVTLTPGPQDATANTDDIFTEGAPLVMEPLADRARAEEIRGSALTRLAELRIPAFTSRPDPALAYMMIILDGDPSDWDGVAYAAPVDCGNAVPGSIAAVNVRSYDGSPVSEVVHGILFGVGISAGLDATDRTAPRNCTRADGLVRGCVFADGVVIPAMYQRCSTGAQDQLAVLAAVHGC